MKNKTIENNSGRISDHVTAGALFCMLLAIYGLTFDGQFKSVDEYLYLSVIQNVSDTGEWLPTSVYPMHPLARYIIEPLHVLLGMGLFQLASWIQVGGVHSVLLLNLFLTALTGVMIFYTGRAQHYSPLPALSAAVVYGLGTMAWPLSKFLFRDSLVTFLLMAATWSFELVFARRHGWSQTLQWLATLALLGLSMVSKQSAFPVIIAFVAAIIVRALFSATERPIVLRGLGLIVLMGVGAFLVSDTVRLQAGRIGEFVTQAINGLLHPDNPFLGQILLALVFSPGKGFFFESPILCLSIACLGLKLRQPAYRTVFYWGALGGLLLSVPLFRNIIWWGGLGWGIRHLLPAAALLSIACLPVFQLLWHNQNRVLLLATTALLLVSMAVQLVGAIGPAVDYVPYIGNPEIERLKVVWDISRSEIVQGAQAILSGASWNIIWARVYACNTPVVQLMLVGLTTTLVASALLLIRSTRSPEMTRAKVGGLIVIFGLTGLILPYGVLRASACDPLYHRQREDFQATLDYLQQQIEPTDVVVLRGMLYSPIWYFFTSEARLNTSWYSFHPQAVEPATLQTIYQENRPELALSDHTRLLFEEVLPPQYHRLWLVSDLNAGNSALRLEEWWLSQRYSSLSAHSIVVSGGHVKISLFALATPPSANQQLADMTLGALIRLKQFAVSSIPQADYLLPGDTVLVDFQWEALQTTPVDYSFGLYVMSSDGAVHAQRDFQPVGGFQPTSMWSTGEVIEDKVGLRLPTDLPPGDYRLVLAVYNWQTLERLPVTGSTQSTLPDNLIILKNVSVIGP